MIKNKNVDSAIILGSLFILAAVFGIIGYIYNYRDTLSSLGSFFNIVSLTRYFIIGIGGLLIILDYEHSVRHTIILSGLTLAVFSIHSVYLNLFFKKEYFSLCAGDFFIGFISIFIGFIFTINTIAFMFNSSKSVSAISYCCIANLILIACELIFLIRHGEHISNLPASMGFAIFFVLSQIYLIMLVSSKGIKHLSLFGSLQRSIRRIRDGLRTNSGICMDRADLQTVINVFNNGMTADKMDFYLKTHYANVYRLVLLKHSDDIQFLIVSAKSVSLMDGFSSTLQGIQIIEDIGVVRFYGDDAQFVQLIIDEFDEKTKDRLASLKY